LLELHDGYYRRLWGKQSEEQEILKKYEELMKKEKEEKERAKKELEDALNARKG
jgi:hypothetical protein